MRALYREAGLDLRADLNRLTATADVTADPWAVADLRRSSMVNGPLRVPHLTMHTLVDELVPVEHVAWYAAHTRHRPDLFRSLYVNATGHCAFQPADDLAALHLLEARLDTGRWPRIALHQPGRLVGGLGEPGRL